MKFISCLSTVEEPFLEENETFYLFFQTLCSENSSFGNKSLFLPTQNKYVVI